MTKLIKNHFKKYIKFSRLNLDRIWCIMFVGDPVGRPWAVFNFMKISIQTACKTIKVRRRITRAAPHKIWRPEGKASGHSAACPLTYDPSWRNYDLCSFNAIRNNNMLRPERAHVNRLVDHVLLWCEKWIMFAPPSPWCLAYQPRLPDRTNPSSKQTYLNTTMFIKNMEIVVFSTDSVL